MCPSPLARLPGRLATALLLCASGVPPLAAQQPASGADRFAPAAERARKEGDKVLKRILLNGAIQRRIVAKPADEPPAAPATAPVPAPVPKPTVARAPAPLPAPLPAPVPRDRPLVPADAAPAAAVAALPAHTDSAPAAQIAASVAEPSAAPALLAPPAPAEPASRPSTPSQEDEPLVVLQEVEPEFPVAIVRRQKKGNVVMRFTVQVDGTVAQIEVVKSTNPFLNPSAIQALSQWKFQPLGRTQTATVEMGFDLAQQLSE